jgi:quercetin dioxygenase-like cupin family protein/alkylhydroperoxidase/carboxymuconolactone decarboxylase family protein YurZ
MFTGDVYFDVIYQGDEPSRMRANVVRFAPCARTAWHTHAMGQTLHVTDGIGLVQSRGGDVVVMGPGDTVYTPPGEWHWHGAAPEHFITHLALWEGPAPDSGQPETQWGEHVTDDEYHGQRGSEDGDRRNAKRNHDELFPAHVSTLAITDPELIEVFDNFAFDEVLRDTSLDLRTRLMVQLASIIACQAVSEYRAMLGAALTAGVTPVEVKEIVYQAVPYVGLAKVFDFETTREWRCRSASSATTRSTPCTPPPPTTRSTSSGIFPRIASVTTSPAPAWTCAPGSCSPFRCWWRSAAPMRR